MFCNTWKLCEIQIIMSVSEAVSGTQPFSLVHMLPVAGFVTQLQNWMIVIETMWPESSQMFTIWPLYLRDRVFRVQLFWA